MKHELLAPAGSLDICKAVIAAGADAVYLGGEKYGARAFAQNFTQDEVLEAIDFAHLYDSKIFLTVNTLLKNREMGKELYEYLLPYYRRGLDAIIVQDYGVFQFVKKYFPELPIHVSTQMSVSNIYGAKLLQEQGADRIVTARELSLSEIREIYDETGIEIESFIHGALCYCYSGQCLMSSMLGGRSGNRGRCAQPCRLAYQVLDEKGKVYHKQEKYPLSPKDLCILEILPKLCEAGIYSFKIEGRMKSLEYAAGVTQIYRKYLDLYETDPEQYTVEKADMEYLLDLGNRNGFTKGYYEMRNGRSMMTLTDSSHSSNQARKAFRADVLQKIPIAGRARIIAGQPLELELNGIQVTGAEVLEAQNRPLTLEDVEARLSKTGDVPFMMQKLDVELGEACFVPVKQLNELRRTGFEALTQSILGKYHREAAEVADQRYELIAADTGSKASQTGINVQVSTLNQLDEVLSYSFVDTISLDLAGENQLFVKKSGIDLHAFIQTVNSCRERIQQQKKKAAFCFPYIFRKNSSAWYNKDEMKAVLAKFDLIWVRSYDSLGFVLNTCGISKEKIGIDHNLYIYSKDAYAAFSNIGFEQYACSFELNQKELRHIPTEKANFCVYGYVPLMISAQCVYKNYSNCYMQDPTDRTLCLNDRYLKKFFIKRSCKDCYNIIYNSQPLYLLHQADVLRKYKFHSYRIIFTSEKNAQVRKIMNDYEKAFLQGKALQAPGEKEGFTNGHFKRGVD